MKISAIIPCLNEDKNIIHVYNQVSKALSIYDDYEIIFIDDGSTDDSLLNIKVLSAQDDKVKYISFARNFGLESAFRVGFLYASFEWCIQYDADMQSPPEETYKLVNKVMEGYDVVFGIRVDRKDSLFRTYGSKAQQYFAKHIFKINLPTGASVFRMISTDTAHKVINYPTRAPYFIATVPLITSNYATVEVEHHPRKLGKSKWNLKKMLGHSFELFFGFSNQLLTVPIINSFLGLLIFIVTALCTKQFFSDNSNILMLLLDANIMLALFSIAAIAVHLKYSGKGCKLQDLVNVKETNIEAYYIDNLRKNNIESTK